MSHIYLIFVSVSCIILNRDKDHVGINSKVCYKVLHITCMQKGNTCFFTWKIYVYVCISDIYNLSYCISQYHLRCLGCEVLLRVIIRAASFLLYLCKYVAVLFYIISLLIRDSHGKFFVTSNFSANCF